MSYIFYFHPYLGKWSNLTNIFQMGWNNQPESIQNFKPHPQKLDIVCPHQNVHCGPAPRAANFHDFLKARRRTYGPQSSRPELSVFFTRQNVISRQLTRSLEWHRQVFFASNTKVKIWQKDADQQGHQYVCICFHLLTYISSLECIYIYTYILEKPIDWNNNIWSLISWKSKGTPTRNKALLRDYWPFVSLRFPWL